MSNGRSRADLLKFIDWMGDKNLLPANTASSRKASANMVFSILSEDEAVDVTSINLDDLMMRFGNKYGQKYGTGSLLTYKSRIRSALEDFKSYCENPLTFKPTGKSRPRARVSTDKSINGKADIKLQPTTVESVGVSVAPPLSAVQILPIAIRPNLTVQIAGLPFDLTELEAKKIANIILAHATA